MEQTTTTTRTVAPAKNNNPDAAPMLRAVQEQAVKDKEIDAAAIKAGPGVVTKTTTTVTKTTTPAKKKAASKESSESAQKAEKPAPAGPAPQDETAPKVTADLSKIESLGLYVNEAEGSVGTDVWRNSARSSVTESIKAMPATSPSPTLQDLKRRLLLTASNVRSLKNDIDITPGNDLFSLRMARLIDLGAYSDAHGMYHLMDSDPYTAHLAGSGILATLYTGQKSLACLELKATSAQLEKDALLEDFMAYCDVSLENTPDNKAVDTLKASKRKLLQTMATNKSYSFVYSPKAFESLSQLEQALIVADGRLDLRNLDRIAKSAIPARHIPLMLVQESLPPREKFMLTLQAVKTGMLSYEEIFSMYEKMLKPGLGEDAKADPVKPNTDWQMLAWLYNYAGNQPPGPEQWKVVKQAFALADVYGDQALIPYASYIAGLKPEGLTVRDIRHAFIATNAAGSALPPYWTAALETLEPEGKVEKLKYYQLYMANYLAQPDARRTPEQRAKIIAYLDGQKSSFSQFAKIIIENLDIVKKDNNNARGIYEKDFGLTSNGDYVMPSKDVWDRLNKASQNKNLGETILLSAAVLQGKSLQETNPVVFRDVLNGLNNVGLNDVSRNLAIEAVLGN